MHICFLEGVTKKCDRTDRSRIARRIQLCLVPPRPALRRGLRLIGLLLFGRDGTERVGGRSTGCVVDIKRTVVKRINNSQESNRKHLTVLTPSTHPQNWPRSIPSQPDPPNNNPSPSVSPPLSPSPQTLHPNTTVSSSCLPHPPSQSSSPHVHPSSYHTTRAGAPPPHP
jgi:hypothetical protein